MKIQVENKLSKENVLVEIPSCVNVSHLSVGEIFTVFLITKEEKKPVEACLVADKRSLIIDGHVVRLPQLKRLSMLESKIVRPVEPKVTAQKKGFGPIKSPMTGKVISVSVQNDSAVKSGDVLLVIEAMKMENRILAEVDGIVKNIKVTGGDNVTAGQVLLNIVASNSK